MHALGLEVLEKNLAILEKGSMPALPGFAVDDNHLEALAAAVKGRPIRVLALDGSFGAAGLNAMTEAAAASGLPVKTARPGHFVAHID